MFLSDLQTKDIISIKDGRKIGNIIDAEISTTGEITNLIVEQKKTLRKIMTSSSEEKINFNKISKIGEDVILVDM